jgi:manganese oxidase
MIKKRRIWLIFSSIFTAVIMATLLVSPAYAQNAQSSVAWGPQAVNYYLYATDGMWTMADGTQLYSYGYIGGRQGQTLNYLDTKVGSATNNLLTFGANGGKVPVPTPGPGGPEAALAGYAQYPAPLIYAGVGDTVTITLKNLGVVNPGAVANDPHTIHLHGLDVDVANDGVPETSLAAIPANSTDPGAGNIIVYMFTPKVAGTYFYHCHQEADIHVTMGMYGALVIYNKDDPGRITGPGAKGTLFGFKYDKDYVMMLSETDANQHFSEGSVNGTALPNANGVFQNFSGVGTGAQNPGDYNPITFQPQYWFINALSFPETVHASGPNFVYSDWEKAHPGYDPLVVGQVKTKQKILVRMINMGFETQPMHMHGFHAKVIAKDQRAWDWANKPNTPTGSGLEENTVLVGSGEEFDLLFDFSTQKVTSTYPNTPVLGQAGGGTESRYDANGPQSNTKTTASPIPIPGASPLTYIPGPTVTGTVDPAIASTSQIFVFHNHDDYKATNNGVYPGGMFTVIIPK